VIGETLAHIQPLAQTGSVTAIQLAADPAEEILVITGSANGDVRVGGGTVAKGGELITAHDGEVSALICVDAEGTRSHVISGSYDGAIRISRVGRGEPDSSKVLGIAHEGVTALSARARDSGHVLTSGGRDGTITSWDLATSMPTKTVLGCRYGAVQAIVNLPDHATGIVVVGGQDGTLSTYRGESLEPRGDATMLGSSVLCLCPLPGINNAVLAGLASGRIAIVRGLGIYEPEIDYIEVSGNELRALGTTMIGGRLFAACTGLDRHLRLIDVETRESRIVIDLDGYGLSLSLLGHSAALGTSAGASILSYPNDILVLTG
jgi:WD40 repeat protein